MKLFSLFRFMLGFIATAISVCGTGLLLLEHGRSFNFVVAAITILTTGCMLPAVYSLEKWEGEE